MIAWSKVESDFEWDGSLRDIYVRSATLEDWRAVYRVLKTSPEVAFRFDGEQVAVPADISDVFAMRGKKSPMLSLKVGSVTVVCHFFTEEEVEFDIDPREVRSQADLDAVLAFLKKIGDSVRKPVLLTPENAPQSEILRYEPASQHFMYASPHRG
jgi:hypothetical protein